jgi:hypothetical protein
LTHFGISRIHQWPKFRRISEKADLAKRTSKKRDDENNANGNYHLFLALIPASVAKIWKKRGRRQLLFEGTCCRLNLVKNCGKSGIFFFENVFKMSLSKNAF